MIFNSKGNWFRNLNFLGVIEGEPRKICEFFGGSRVLREGRGE